jgi:hypothetical protein
MKATSQQKKEWLNEIKSCLETMYSGNRNKWRLNEEFEIAKNEIQSGHEYRIKRAQWGGKWGNWYRMIALNSKGEYQFVCGFNPHKQLL